MFSGHGLEIGGDLVSPGQKLVEAALWMARDDTADGIDEVGMRFRHLIT